jgi:DNA-binding PadR family transcriptional regulator
MNPFHPWVRHDPMANGSFDPRMRFFHGPGAGGPFGPRNPFRAMRPRKPFFKRGGIKFALLELLLEGPMHGYEMIKKLEEITGGVYVPSPGSIYPTLQLLEDEGYVTVEEREGKKLYCITDAGRNYLKENQKERSSFISSEFEPFVRHQDVQQIHLEAAELSRLVMFVTHQVLRRSNDEENKEILHFLKKTRNELLALLQQQDQQPED